MRNKKNYIKALKKKGMYSTRTREGVNYLYPLADACKFVNRGKERIFRGNGIGKKSNRSIANGYKINRKGTEKFRYSKGILDGQYVK